MIQSSAVKPYRSLGLYYDELFSALHSPIDTARERLLGRILPHVETACDLACGTGMTAVRLASRGIKMYGVDLSPTMCRLARQRAARAGLPVRVIRADMRSFRLPEPVDLVICEGDALNHVPHRRDLRQVLKAVARALRPGGQFFLDVNNLPGFERYWKGVVWCETAHVVLVMRNGNDARSGRAWSDIEWFIREGALWRRRSERVEEVSWEPGVIPRTLKDVGFDQVRELDATPFFRPVRNTNVPEDSLIGPGCRSFYTARKSPG